LKTKQTGICTHLTEAFIAELKQYGVHRYNIVNQYNELKKFKCNLKESECAIIIVRITQKSLHVRFS